MVSYGILNQILGQKIQWITLIPKTAVIAVAIVSVWSQLVMNAVNGLLPASRNIPKTSMRPTALTAQAKSDRFFTNHPCPWSPQCFASIHAP